MYIYGVLQDRASPRLPYCRRGDNEIPPARSVRLFFTSETVSAGTSRFDAELLPGKLGDFVEGVRDDGRIVGGEGEDVDCDNGREFCEVRDVGAGFREVRDYC